MYSCVSCEVRSAPSTAEAAPAERQRNSWRPIARTVELASPTNSTVYRSLEISQAPVLPSTRESHFTVFSRETRRVAFDASPVMFEASRSTATSSTIPPTTDDDDDDAAASAASTAAAADEIGSPQTRPR